MKEPVVQKAKSIAKYTRIYHTYFVNVRTSLLSLLSIIDSFLSLSIFFKTFSFFISAHLSITKTGKHLLDMAHDSPLATKYRPLILKPQSSIASSIYLKRA